MAQTADDPITQQPGDVQAETPAPPAPPEPAPVGAPVAPRAPAARPPAAARRRRTRVEVRHVGPLSVLRFSLLFYLCAMLIGFLALFFIYQVLEASGTIETLETDILGCLFQEGERATTGTCVPYEIDGGTVFTWLFLAGAAGAVVIALLNTFIAIVYNLISDIVGGVEVTLAERGKRT
jgi:hypothetical protein